MDGQSQITLSYYQVFYLQVQWIDFHSHSGLLETGLRSQNQVPLDHMPRRRDKVCQHRSGHHALVAMPRQDHGRCTTLGERRAEVKHLLNEPREDEAWGSGQILLRESNEWQP